MATKQQAPHYDFNMLYGNVYRRKLTPLQAIKHYCWYCCGGHEDPWRLSDGSVEPPYRPRTDVRECTCTNCYLHPFRMGRNPRRKGTGGGNAGNLKNQRK